MKIVYLHGLESNADQKDPKIIFLNNNFDEVFTPSINYKDKNTFAKLFSKIKAINPDLIVGSSMGGYFAYLIGSKLSIETVLFNPAVVGRAFDPIVDDTNLSGARHNVFLGKSDNVISGKDIKSYLNSNGVGNFKYRSYKGGHRVSEDTFINSIKNIAGIKENDSSQIYTKRKYIKMKHIKTITELASNINESKFNKKKLMKAIKKDDGMISTGDGKEYLVYNPKNGYAGAEDMWQDDVVFALDQDGGEHEIKYSDIVRFDESKVNEKLSNAEVKKIWKTKEYKEISQAIRDDQEDYEDMWNQIDPKMFKGLDQSKFEDILGDWFNANGSAYDSYSDFAKNAASYDVAEITKLLIPFNEGTLIDLRLVNESVEDEIELALTNWLNTLADGNAVAMTDLYLENGVLLGTLAKEIKQGHEQLQQYFEMFLKKSPIGSVDSFILQNFGDVCISDGTYTFEMDSESGNRESVAARYTYVWKKENKKWMIATHHSSVNPK